MAETPTTPKKKARRTPPRPGPAVRPRRAAKPDTDRPVPWNVVLLDDDDHTVEYVVTMMQELFACSIERGVQVADTVHHEGRAVCLTTHKEHAELKRDQILAFGADPLVAECKGSMTAIIEPAEFGGDEDERGGGG